MNVVFIGASKFGRRCLDIMRTILSANYKKNAEDFSFLERLLLKKVQVIQKKLVQRTIKKHRRLNPFYEDLFSWNERFSLWSEDDGKGITIYNSSTLIGDVEVGEKTWIGPFTMIDGSGGLSIGKYCSIATGVHIFSHDTVKWALSGGREEYEQAPVSIGDCCFVGAQSIILKGVSIGNHCLIGAGSVVTRDIPDYSIAAGVPARVVGRVVVDDKGVKLDWF